MKNKNLLKYYQSMPNLFSVNKHPDKDLWIVIYHHLGIDWSLPGALDARGLVLDSSGKIIARPYKKFFNYKELTKPDNWDEEENGEFFHKHLPQEIVDLSEWDEYSDYIVQEKSDGSFILVFGYEDELIFATSKVFHGPHVEKAKELFYSQFTEEQIEKIKNEIIYTDSTFLFELVGPSNIHVVKYEKDQLILHDIMQKDENYYNIYYAGKFAEKFNIPMVKTYDHKLDDLLDLKENAKDIEGFVVKFKSGKILKIKTNEYIELSRDTQIFYGRFHTKRKLRSVIQALIDDEFDDLVASAENHPDVKENLLEVQAEYIKYVKHLEELEKGWKDGKWFGLTPKEIAQNKDIEKERQRDIFLSRRDRSAWERSIMSTLLSLFEDRDRQLSDI